MIKLDDFLSKKKEPAQVLDLSKVKITSKDEFKRYFDKIPECKVKPEKISSDQVKIREKDFTFLPGKKEEKQVREWNYPDPTPPDMKGVKLEDLCPINIDWKMLTTMRPKLKVEEDMFSRLVHLGKLDLKYQQSLAREKKTDWIRRTKNPKSSIIEMRVISCKECGEDFCDGSLCSKLTYESFFRPQPATSNLNQNLSFLASGPESKTATTKKKRKKKKKRRRKKKGENGEGGKRRRKLGKTSIFNRPPNAGCTRNHFREKGGEPDVKFRIRALSSTRSFSSERKQIGFIPKRSKSAPRIHFNCETTDSDFKRHDYASDSGPTNTDYSSQSDSESPDRRFFSPRLRLSGRRKLLSARVSFSDRKQRRDSVQLSSRSKFVRRCTLYRDGDEKFATTSESSSPTRSKSPEKNYFRSPSSTKPPSTVRIEFDEEFRGGQSADSATISAWPIAFLLNSNLKKNIVSKKPMESGKFSRNATKSEFDSGSSWGVNKYGREKSKSKKCKNKTENSIETDSCLKTKGIFGKINTD